MIKWFSAEGGTSIVLLKDRVINISELHLWRGETGGGGVQKVSKSSHCNINYGLDH